MKLATLQAGQFVETGGYYVKGDAGAARYLIKAAQAFDGYGDHELANGTVAVLQVDGDVINVRTYGALDDGGATDSQPAIWAALTNGSIDLDGGSYGFKNPIDLDFSNREIIGNGGTLSYTSDWVHTREGTPLEQLYFFNFGTDGGRPNTSSSVTVHNIRISGVTFDGLQPASIVNGDTIYKSVMIEVGQASSDVIIEKCTFLRPRSYSPSRGSIFGRTGTKNITIDKCNVTNPNQNTGEGGGGLVLSGTHSRITNCYCENLTDAAIGLDDADYTQVTDNTIIQNMTDGGGSLISVGAQMQITLGASYNVIKGNTFRGISSNGITMYGNGVLPDCKGNIIQGNTFDGGGFVSNAASYGIILDQYVKNTIIDGNNFLNWSNTSAGSALVRCYPRNNQVTNNIISDLNASGNRSNQLMRGVAIRFGVEADETLLVTGNSIMVGGASVFFSGGDYLDTKAMIVEGNILNAGTGDTLNKSVTGVDIDNAGTKYLRINDNQFIGTFSSDWTGTWDYIAYFQASGLSHTRPNTSVGYTNKVLWRNIMPPSKSWVSGDVVKNTTKTVDGNNMILDHWLRITTGSGNVLNTDWVAQYTSTVSPAT